MNYKDFQEYLYYKHSEQNPEVLDDMLPDDYERWLEDNLLFIVKWLNIVLCVFFMNADVFLCHFLCLIPWYFIF